MTQSEFIKNYADRSGVTESRLNELGQFAFPCECDAQECQGWAMISKKTLEDHVNLYLGK